MIGRPPRPTLGQAAAFLARRLAPAVHAAILLAVLAVTAVAVQILRLLALGLMMVAAAIPRRIAAWWTRRRARRRTKRRTKRRTRRRGDATPARQRLPRVRATWRALRQPMSHVFDHVLPSVNVGALLALRHGAQRERHDIGRFRNTVVRVEYQPLPDGGTRPSVMALLRDAATWRDLLYWLATVALLPVTLTAAVGSWALAPFVASAWLLAQFTVGLQPPVRPAPAVWWSSLSAIDTVLVVALTVAAAALAPTLLRACAAAHAGLGVSLLGPGEQARLQAELDEQRLRRRLAVEAAEAERRRIERDLHDGAQQRLVSLAMTLGLARQKFASDPDVAEKLVAEAHDEAKQALGELRTLARGIHPAVLTDRGLDAALSALAQRVGVPVEVEVDLARRPSTASESAAYFVVAEALTNVARHAAATMVTVAVTGTADHIVVEITDDGLGGADPTRGTGLTGLADRVDSVDGHIEVRSPHGGPTIIRAELPCAS